MFKIYDGRDSFYQWDVDRKLIVEDPEISEVHFCNRTDECSLVVETYVEDGLTLANVPNVLLQMDWKINVYAYDKQYTKHCEVFKVNKRSKPADYVYTETEIKNYDDLEERLEKLEEAEGTEQFCKVNEGLGSIAFNDYKTNTANASYSTAFGSNTKATGLYSFAAGYGTSAKGAYSVAIGKENEANASMSFASGYKTKAKGTYSHTEGIYTEATLTAAHAEGANTTASGYASHAEGDNTFAQGNEAHAEGYLTYATGNESHAEGEETVAEGRASHAEGRLSEAHGNYAHAEGYKTINNGTASHTEGANTTINHGLNSKDTSEGAHAEGMSTIAHGRAQHVQGKYNIEDTEIKSNGYGKYAHIVGNGDYNSGNPIRSNAHTLDWSGNAWFAGEITVGSDNKKIATEKYVEETINAALGVIENGTY